VNAIESRIELREPARDLSELWLAHQRAPGGTTRGALLGQYLWLVECEAQRALLKVRRGAVEYGELVNEGVIGLAMALERFNACSATSFPAFARWRVRDQIADYLRSADPLPKGRRGRIRELELAVEALRGHLGEEPTPQQVCRYLGIDLADYRQRRQDQLNARVLSLDAMQDPDDESDDSRKAVVPADPNAQVPDGQPRRTELLILVAIEIDSLPRIQRLVLVLRFVAGLTREQTGAVLGLPACQVYRLEKAALATLRDKLRERLPGRL
jgi:RNA polymerase sigma factor for flagellar operon FliA